MTISKNVQSSWYFCNIHRRLTTKKLILHDSLSVTCKWCRVWAQSRANPFLFSDYSRLVGDFAPNRSSRHPSQDSESLIRLHRRWAWRLRLPSQPNTVSGRCADAYQLCNASNPSTFPIQNVKPRAYQRSVNRKAALSNKKDWLYIACTGNAWKHLHFSVQFSTLAM